MEWKILNPIRLGGRISRNRILMAAHSYGYADENGLPTQYLVDYLVERAKGGVGLLIMGGTAVSPEGALPIGNITRNLSDDIIPWYKQISAQIHENGALIIDQLMHAGGLLRAREGVRILAPSPIPHERTRGIPTELSILEINRIIQDFANAARRVKDGGLDGVEIKCDQGFLIQQFLSPYYNRRTDKYGGDVNRTRFLFEVVSAIREVLGKDLILGVRISGDTLSAGDLTLKDSVMIAKKLEGTGNLDYVHVSGATNSSFLGYLVGHGDSSVSPRNFVPFARVIKTNVKLPVIASSMILTPQDAEDVIDNNQADMVAMTRAHIADPEIINKISQNRVEDIRPCILINQGCVGNHYVGFPVRCIQNPAAGREGSLGKDSYKSASISKSIVVVGGGIAGMEFARVAAIRGHKVTIYEKNKDMGGQLLLAGKMPYRQGFLELVRYEEQQCIKSGVKIHRNIEITEQELNIISSEHDIVVLATGAEPFIPQNYFNLGKSNILTLKDLLDGKTEIEENILIVDVDWRQNSLGIAEWLLNQNKRVTIISTAYFVGDGLDIVSLTSYYSRISKNIILIPLTDIDAFHPKNRTVTLRNILTKVTSELHPIDQVIFVSGSKPMNYLSTSIQDTTKFYSIGDCVNSLGVPEAMLNAVSLAVKI